MRLGDFLKQENLSAQEFATKISRAPSTVTRILRRETVPDKATVQAIIEVTGGAVTPNDFFDLPPNEGEAA